MILLPKLRSLTLEKLKNLISFCTSKSEDHPLFNSQEPRGLVGLQSLQYLAIIDCSLLRNLFTSSVATALEQLEVLDLRSCPAMQEVIATDEGHKEIIDEIVFPQLEWLILKDLSNLKSFCSAVCDFNFPSLKRVVLKRCPKMQTFSSGSLCMTQMKLYTQDDESSEVEDDEFLEVEDDESSEDEDDQFDDEWLEIDCDLNKYLEQRLLKGEESPMVEALVEQTNSDSDSDSDSGNEESPRYDYGYEDDLLLWFQTRAEQ